MYLKKSKRKNGRIHLSICKNYREQGKNKTKTIATIGYADQYADQFEDPIAHFEELVAELDEKHRNTEGPIVLKFDPTKTIETKGSNRKNLGCAVLAHYYHALDLHIFWQRKASEECFPGDANTIFKVLMYSRLLYPNIRYRNYLERDRWFLHDSFGSTEFYQAMGFFANHRREFVNKINASIDKVHDRRYEQLFYHLFDFQTELGSIHKYKNKDGDAEEHLPLRMGLLLDSDRVPVNYRVFPGKTTEPETLEAILREQEDQGAASASSRVIVVADREIAPKNIAYLVGAGHGFAYTEPLASAPKKLKDWLADGEGYHSIGPMKVKTQIATKTVWPDGESGEPLYVTVKRVALWIPDHEQLTDLQTMRISRRFQTIWKTHGEIPFLKRIAAKDLLEKKDALYEQTPESENPLGATSGERDDDSEEFDGYRIVTTSELDLDETTIPRLFRSFWIIEKEFSFADLDIMTRPFYTSLEEMVESHLVVHYAALVIMRLIAVETDHAFSSQSIREELSHLECSHLQENWWHLDYRSDITDTLCELVGIDLSKQILSLQQIRSIFAQTRKAKLREGPEPTMPAK